MTKKRDTSTFSLDLSNRVTASEIFVSSAVGGLTPYQQKMVDQANEHALGLQFMKAKGSLAVKLTTDVQIAARESFGRTVRHITDEHQLKEGSPECQQIMQEYDQTLIQVAGQDSIGLVSAVSHQIGTIAASTPFPPVEVKARKTGFLAGIGRALSGDD